MSRIITVTIYATIIAAVTGCGSRGQLDVLESRLRQQEAMLAQANSRLANTQQELAIARRETELIRQRALASGQQFVLPEQTQPAARLTKVEFNTLLTGPVPADPGKYSVVLSPLDASDATLQIPGAITIKAFHMKRGSRQEKIGQWDYEPHQAAAYWQQGFLASGYIFTLPIEPNAIANNANSSVMLTAMLRTTDGRVFETSHEVSGNGSFDGPQAKTVSQTKPKEPLPIAPAPDERTSDVWNTESIPVLR